MAKGTNKGITVIIHFFDSPLQRNRSKIQHKILFFNDEPENLNDEIKRILYKSPIQKAIFSKTGIFPSFTKTIIEQTSFQDYLRYKKNAKRYCLTCLQMKMLSNMKENLEKKKKKEE